MQRIFVTCSEKITKTNSEYVKSRSKHDVLFVLFFHCLSDGSGFFIGFFDLKSYHLKFLLTAETKEYNPVKQ